MALSECSSANVPRRPMSARGSRHADLDVDLGAPAFIRAAISVILRERESLWPRARTLTLRSPSTNARRVLELCRLAARMTGNVRSLALADYGVDSTLVPSVRRATG